MNVVFAHHLSLSYYGGGEKFIISVAKGLTERGHDVEIYSLPFLLEGKQKFNPSNFLDGIPYEEVVKKSIKADVVYITYHPLSWLSFRASRPRIAGMHSETYWHNPHPSYGFLPNVANIFNRFLSYFELRRFDAVHTITNVYRVNHPKVFFIPNFVDSEEFRPVIPKNEDFTIAFASRKVWQKGWDIFREVKRILKNDGVSVKVSGGINEEEMADFFSSSHITVVPSRVDTFGLTIVESMMCGTPVITTPLNTHRSLGLPLMFATTPKQFVDQIEKTKAMPEGEYKNFSRLCRKKALKYDKKNVIDKFEEMLETVAA